MQVKIAEIKILDRKRKLKSKVVAILAESIENFGLLNPITISKNFELIAGLHRLKAAESLGWGEILVNVVDMNELDAELAALDENLIRCDLHYIERGERLKWHKEIYELKYPETKNGGDRRSGKKIPQRHRDGVKLSFSEDTANKTNLSQRTIQREIQIATHLDPKVKEIVMEKDIQKTKALMMARQTPEEQRQTIKNLIADKTQKEIEEDKGDRVNIMESAEGRSEYLKYKNGEEISLQQAVKAKCYDCTYGYTDGAEDCETPHCPLYSYMPYNPNRVMAVELL